jgi:hypothetical protein
MRRAFDVECRPARAGAGGCGCATVEDSEAIRAILAALAGTRAVVAQAPPGAAREPPRFALVLGA